jgi:chromosome segregation ATPase
MDAGRHPHVSKRGNPAGGPTGIPSPSVQEVSLAQVADELYELAPADFRAARDERANQARAAGDRELSDAIRKLRRPTVSAWLVNQLVRQAPDEIARLVELGESLREAQQTLAGDRLRELSAQRRQVVRELTQEAKRLAAEARRPVSDQAEREVEATLEAALADPAAADAVRSGRLTTGLVYAGLGGIDMAEAVAVPAAPPGRARERAAAPASADQRAAERTAGKQKRAAGADGGPPEPDAGERAREAAARKARETAEQALREAETAAREADEELDEAGQRVAQARERYEEIQRRIEELEQRLEQAQTEETQAARAVREARRARDVAARAADTAQRRLGQAQATLDRLE